MCKTGTSQSPIDLLSSYGLATTHKPSFSNYDRTVKGDLFNWGFGPSYTLYTTSGITSLPALKFDGRTVYLSGWHLHFPSEHLIAGRRSQGELHLVHVDAAGNPAAVIGILVDVGAAPSGFMGVPVIPGPDSGTVVKDVGLNMYLAIKEAGGLKNYYTYSGSLTTPACTEGIRWFVSNDKVTVTQQQMNALLQSNGGRYSARNVQRIGDQKVNQ
jgi:carbonic anhydrase